MNQSAPRSGCCPCGAPITDINDSEEHIIPNSLGGRLKTRGFICIECNSWTGRTWDAEAARQLNFLSLFFGIVRERGESPAELVQTTAGERLLMQPGGGFMLDKPSHQETKTDVGTQINIVARTMDEARRMLDGVSRKYPSVNAKAMLESASANYKYPEGVVHAKLGFGGTLSGRSVVKTALAMAHDAGVPAASCNDAIAYLRNEDAAACFGYYYEKDLVSGRPAGIPLHCVAISGNSRTSLLLGYVEYFGVQRMVVCLSRAYHGPEIQAVYGVNPLTGERLAVSVALPFSEAEISLIYNYEKIPEDGIQQAFAQVIPTGLQLQFEREKDRVIKDAVQYAFANCGAKEGEILTPEQKARLPKLVTDRLMPFILHNVRKPPPSTTR